MKIANLLHSKSVPLDHSKAQLLSEFYSSFPNDVKKLFRPHSFDPLELKKLIESHYRYRGYLSIRDQQILGYAACYLGHFEHDIVRFENYNYSLSFQQDAQFAPLVYPSFHGKGIAQTLLQNAKEALREIGIKRLFLWGGVQANNEPAIRFYLKSGFKEIGRFYHDGENIDMYLPIA